MRQTRCPWIAPVLTVHLALSFALPGTATSSDAPTVLATRDLEARPGRTCLVVHAKDASAGVELGLARWGRGSDLLAAEAPEWRVNDGGLECRRGPVTEFYACTPRGLQQVFLVAERPEGSGELLLELSPGDDVRASVAAGGTSARLVRSTGRCYDYEGLRAWDAEGRVLEARLTGGVGRLSIVVEDAGACYPLVIDPWILVRDALRTNPGTTAAYRHGAAVAISGFRQALAAPGHSADRGVVYITAGTPELTLWEDFLQPADTVSGDVFGEAVDLADPWAVVGAPGADVGGLVDCGAVYVFRRQTNDWLEWQKLTASDKAAGDRFGGSVSIDGDTLVVGAKEWDEGAANVGAVYVFRFGGMFYSQEAKLLAFDGGANDRFGHDVALSGDRLVVGAPQWDGASLANLGAVYTYHRSGTTWSFENRIGVLGATAYDYLGSSVAVDGTTVLAGARGYEVPPYGECGAAFVFERSGSLWTIEARLEADVPGAGDSFGEAVALRQGLALIGAPAHDQHGTNSGATYLYRRTGTSWSAPLKHAPSALSANDGLGTSVAVAPGQWVLAGAPGYDDVNTDQGAVWHYWPAWDVGTPFCVPLLPPQCPCGNMGALGTREGCRNSEGYGAWLYTQGEPSVSHDTLEVWVEQAIPQDFGIFVQNVSIGTVTRFYDGKLCLALDSHLVRHYGVGVPATDGDYWGRGKNSVSFTLSDYLGDTQAGVTVHYQYWYRDNLGPCSTGANFSGGVSVVWVP